MHMKHKFKQLITLLDEIEELSTCPDSREEKLREAREFENILRYRVVDIESGLLDAVTEADTKRITKENAEEILSQYPPGFHRSELRTYKNRKEEDNEKS